MSRMLVGFITLGVGIILLSIGMMIVIMMAAELTVGLSDPPKNPAGVLFTGVAPGVFLLWNGWRDIQRALAAEEKEDRAERELRKEVRELEQRRKLAEEEL